MGCDPSTHLSHKWAFSIVDKCIILEDDLVPTQTFFTFCKEMLDKYENDTRIDRICGTNLLGEYNIPNDYFFSSTGNSWGWASWKRVADTWETDYSFVEDEYALNCMRLIQGNCDAHLKWEERCKEDKKKAVPYWEFIVGASSLLNHSLVIYPKVNMIHNIGLDKNSTHAPEDINDLPKEVKQYFTVPTQDLGFPLKHPKYVVEDKNFYMLIKEKYKIGFWSRVGAKIQKVFKKIFSK